MADEGNLNVPDSDTCEIDDISLSGIGDDQFSFDDDDDTEENTNSTFQDNDADANNSSTGMRFADLSRDDRFQLSWGSASWTLTESMDTDHFFLVPPSRDLHMSRSSFRRQFVLPSSAVRRSGEHTFPISPPTRTKLEAGAANANLDRSPDSGGGVASQLPPPPISPPAPTGEEEANPSEASLRPRTSNATELCTSSPTGVATYSLNRNDARRSQTPTTVSNQGPAPPTVHSHPPLSPTLTSKKRVISRQDSLTYSIGHSVGHSAGGASSITGRLSKNAPTSGIVDDDGGDSSLFRNLYEDDQSLYLDEDCLTECADPRYKSNRAFITSDEAQNTSSTSHEMSPILKLLKTLTNFCRPHGTPRQKISAKPRKYTSKHRKIKSDPELLTDMLEDRLIMTKKTVETMPWEHFQDGDFSEEGTTSKKTAAAAASNGPPVIIKFRPSQLTSSCIQELAFQIDSKAEFVLDDSRSLPDSLYQPNLDGG
mmetsp:Transcript_6256/g.17498  ORF Transcript_6256/g.17498 Transcript_6256/m.17498 type:complete len:483 (+) Transcript_6256:227-1675(+)